MHTSLAPHIAWFVGAALFCGALFPLPAYAAQVTVQPDLTWMRTLLIERYVEKFGYAQGAALSSSAPNVSLAAALPQGSPLLRNLGTLMALYALFRNSNNNGLLNPGGANVGDIIVLYMLFYQQGSS